MKRSSWQFCNVLRTGADGRQVWQFEHRSEGLRLAADHRSLASDPMPLGLVGRNWSQLVRPRLNIAWLPAQRVFIRALHLPTADSSELQGMVELQLEKVSPLPVTQIVWSYEVLPNPEPGMQTILVVIVDRRLTEDFLGRLEQGGFLADRLEVPVLSRLASLPPGTDGVWILLQPEDDHTVGVAVWRVKGQIQHVQWIVLPAGPEHAGTLAAQLRQTCWAGELEGWMPPGEPRWQLSAPPTFLAAWQPALTQAIGQSVEPSPWADHAAIAESCALRARSTHSDPGLLPADIADRYRQQFIDRLWMNGLGAVIGIYFAGVLIYFGSLEWRRHQVQQAESQALALSQVYTNTLQLKARSQILQDQAELRFASLDCWKITSDLLPAELTLNSFEFSRGRSVSLRGTAPVESQAKVTEFNSALAKVSLNGSPLFKKVNPASIAPSPGAAGSQLAQWSFTAELNRTEEP